jgi:hypothetical protein
MNEELLSKIEELENKLAALESAQNTLDPIKEASFLSRVPIVETFTAGSAGTNGYLRVTIDGISYKLMTTA